MLIFYQDYRGDLEDFLEAWKARELGYRSSGPFALTPTYIWRVP